MVLGLYRLYQIIGAILVLTSVLIAYGIIPNPIPTTPFKQSGILAIENINVIPMDTERVIENQTVIIRNGHIAVMRDSDSITIPNGANVVDGNGKYLIPGLMDIEVNLEHYDYEDLSEVDDEYLFPFLAEGVTSLRAVGSTEIGNELRDAVSIGRIEGPRMMTSHRVPNVDILGSHRSENLIIVSERQARQDVREIVEAGYDSLAFRTGINQDFVPGILEEANKHDLITLLRYVGFSQTTEDLWDEEKFYSETLESPLSGIQGALIVGFTESYGFDLERFAQGLAANGVFVTTDALDHEVRMSYDPGYNHGVPEFFTALIDNDVVILVGSWNARGSEELFHVRTTDQILALTEIGLTPYEALRTATANISENIEPFSDAGVVETGRRADLVILNNNPLENIEHVRDIDGVVVKGRFLSRTMIDIKLDRIQGE